MVSSLTKLIFDGNKLSKKHTLGHPENYVLCVGLYYITYKECFWIKFYLLVILSFISSIGNLLFSNLLNIMFLLISSLPFFFVIFLKYLRQNIWTLAFMCFTFKSNLNKKTLVKTLIKTLISYCIIFETNK